MILSKFLVFILGNNENLPVCGLSNQPKETPDLINVTQIASTVMNVLGYNYEFPNHPFYKF